MLESLEWIPGFLVVYQHQSPSLVSMDLVLLCTAIDQILIYHAADQVFFHAHYCYNWVTQM